VWSSYTCGHTGWLKHADGPEDPAWETDCPSCKSERHPLWLARPRGKLCPVGGTPHIPTHYCIYYHWGGERE